MIKKIFISSLFTLTCVAAVAQTAPAPSSAFDSFMSQIVGGGKQTVSFGSNGTPVTSQGIPSLTSQGVTTANGSVYSAVNSVHTGSIATANGKIPITATGSIPKTQVAKVLGSFLGKAIPGVALGLAVIDLAKELGFSAKKNADNTFTFAKEVDTIDSKNDYQIGGNGWFRTSSASCLDQLERKRVAGGIYGSFQRYELVQNTPDCRGLYYYPPHFNMGAASSIDTYQVRVTQLNGATSYPATAEDVAGAAAVRAGFTPASKMPEVLAEAGAQAAPADKLKPEVTSLTGPATFGEPRISTIEKPVSITTPQGTTEGIEKTTTTCVDKASYSGSSVTVSEQCTQIIAAPNGTTKTGVITASSEATKPAAEPQITCGLPATPPCKIDETGTQTSAPDVATQSKSDIDAAKTAAVDEIGKAASITAPAWSFSFQFPTGCAPYATGIRGFILNVCPYQPQIHGLLSAIWAAATLFAMIGMVGKTIRGE